MSVTETSYTPLPIIKNFVREFIQEQPPSSVARQAEVVTVHSNQTLDIKLGGSGIIIPGVAKLVSYRPALAGDIVWVIQTGPDLLVMGKIDSTQGWRLPDGYTPSSSGHASIPPGVSYWRVIGASSGWPVADGTVMTVNHGNDSRTHQIFTSTDGTLYIRRLTGPTTWSAWKQLATTDELPRTATGAGMSLSTRSPETLNDWLVWGAGDSIVLSLGPGAWHVQTQVIGRCRWNVSSASRRIGGVRVGIFNGSVWADGNGIDTEIHGNDQRSTTVGGSHQWTGTPSGGSVVVRAYCRQASLGSGGDLLFEQGRLSVQAFPA